jgi:hypothetical protein
MRRWIYYRYLRAIASSYNKIRKMDFKHSESDDVQKAILKIAIRVINMQSTQFLVSESSYYFINPNLTILVSYENQSPTVTITSGSDIQKVNINNEYVSSILSSYEREVSRRMRKSFSDRNKLIIGKLDEIYKNLG